MIPRLVSPVTREKVPRPITTIPTDLKKRGAYFDLENDADPKERRARTGNVPSAKNSMRENPPINEPLERAEICIDCVKPHGRKNVPIPINSGAKKDPSFLLKNEKRELGSVTVLFLYTPARLSPSMIMTSAAAIPSIEEKNKLIPIAFPMSPRIPPKNANPSIRPEWKRIIELFHFVPLYHICAESESINPPTIARQLETDATSPTIKLVVGVILPFTEKLRIPDFCKAKKRASITSPIGSACQIRPSFFELSSCTSCEIS